jgi:FkbM family methyltransferase
MTLKVDSSSSALKYLDEGSEPADLELRLLLALTHRLPRVRGAVRLAVLARRLFLRKLRRAIDADVLGLRMHLDPSDWVQGGLLFWPQLWDYREFEYLARTLREGDTFVDVGAHVGFNSLIASRLVGSTGAVLAIEASPDLFSRLTHHIILNGATNIHPVNIAASDRRGIAYLSGCPSDNSGGRSVLGADRHGVPVPCAPLSEVLREAGITRVTGAWLEIAGSEFKVLNRFLSDVRREAWPQFLVVERNPGWAAQAGGDVSVLLNDAGYCERRVASTTPDRVNNQIFVLRV